MRCRLSHQRAAELALIGWERNEAHARSPRSQTRSTPRTQDQTQRGDVCWRRARYQQMDAELQGYGPVPVYHSPPVGMQPAKIDAATHPDNAWARPWSGPGAPGGMVMLPGMDSSRGGLGPLAGPLEPSPVPFGSTTLRYHHIEPSVSLTSHTTRRYWGCLVVGEHGRFSTVSPFPHGESGL